MDTATARTPAFHRAVFEDGLGTRHHADAPGGEPLEVLEVRDLFSTEAFERALGDRVAALGNFHSTWFTQVRTVQRVNQGTSKLFVVYDRVSGSRLSSILAASKQPLEVNATLCLIRQLVAGIALLHEKLPSIAHGAIGPERVIITPKARLVVSDYVLGAALEQLQYTPDQYWDELRVPLPNELEPTFNQRADVMQIGVLALELILGRKLERDEYPLRIHELTERAWSVSASRDAKPLPSELRTWLLRMLQLDTVHDFASAVDAWEDLEHVLLGSDNRASFLALEAVVSEFASKGSAPAKTVTPSLHIVPVSKTAPPKPFSTSPFPTPTSSATVPVTPSVTPAEPAATESVASAATDEPTFAAAPSTDNEPDAGPRLVEPLAFPQRLAQEDTEVPKTSRGRGRLLAAAAVIVALVGGGAFFSRQYLVPSAAAEAPGTLVVTTNPAGYQVFIDGQPRGATPLTVELAAGAHELKLATDGEPRVIPITITAGGTVAQTLELPKVAPRVGNLAIRTDQPGVRVKVDGTARGVTPLTIEGLTPGAHSVTLETDVNAVSQDVMIEAGTTASLVVPMNAPEGVPVSGWISVDAPAELQVLEDGRLLGTSKTDRIMVSAGRHAFELVNETLGYRVTRTVTVAPGKVSAIRLEWPKGSLALNAQPWADVWIGGKRIGETPIGNISLPIGMHEVTFRHPQLGDQVVHATVTATAPTRVTVDLRKQ
jgi:serine/threonine protein kinase